MAAIIFDFDGTIADTFDDVVRILHDLTGRHEPLPPDEIERLRGMTLMNAAEEMHVAPWKMPFLIIRIRRRMKRKMADIPAHRGIEEVIQKLQAEGHQLYITSTNSGRNIQTFLRHHGLVYEFVRIYSGVGLFHKTRALKKIIRQNNLNPDDTWYVGDEVRDVVGGQQAGLRVVAVTWGYNNAAILREHHPTVLVRSPTELLKTLEEQ
jgi:phosphoglycolate phosphatase